jgi:hypothetical protein
VNRTERDWFKRNGIHRHRRYSRSRHSPGSETANDVREALSKARQMYETGLVNVSIKDDGGRKIEGDELVACITGKKTITSDLQAQ